MALGKKNGVVGYTEAFFLSVSLLKCSWILKFQGLAGLGEVCALSVSVSVPVPRGTEGRTGFKYAYKLCYSLLETSGSLAM